MLKLKIKKQVNEILSRAEMNKLFDKIKCINRYKADVQCRNPKLSELAIKEILGKEGTQVEMLEYEYLKDGGSYSIPYGYRVSYYNQVHEYSFFPEYSFPN